MPYRGGADAANAILSGSTPVAFSGIANFIPHIRSGAMTALAVDTDERSPLLPDVPTLREIRLQGSARAGLFRAGRAERHAESGCRQLHELIAEIGSDKAFVERNMTNLGLIPIFNTPDQFAAFLKENWTVAERIVKESGRAAVIRHRPGILDRRVKCRRQIAGSLSIHRS